MHDRPLGVDDDVHVDVDRVVGRTIAGYTVEAVLGVGAMGVVYAARQQMPDRRVALKLITPAFATDETFRQRFLREATASAAIEHPHILPVYEAGESDQTLFMAMRLVDGMELREIVRGSSGLPLERVIAIARQVGSALDAAHDRGLVHRDVKSGNVLVTASGDADEPDYCYVTDFGVSTWTSSSIASITATGQMIGTANYVAPEQIEGGPVDARADTYSLGCVLFECLTGQPPFAGRPPAAILYAHIHEAPPSVEALRPDLPPGVDAVIGRALRKVPAERYASSRDLTQGLRAVMDGTATTSVASPAVPASRTERRRTRFRITAAIVAAVLVVAGAAVAGVVLNRDTSKPPSTVQPVLIRDGVQVTASNTAPASHDAAGNVVTYQPSNVIDGDVETAWRTPGDGTGESLILISQWTGQNPVLTTPAYGQIPDAGGQRQQIIDELKQLNGKMDGLMSTLKSGDVQVRVPKEDKK